MNEYIGTFHTHLSALMTSRKLTSLGLMARMMPVPRKLSSSCGTCVYYKAEDPHLEVMDEDVEGVYMVIGKEEYSTVMENA